MRIRQKSPKLRNSGQKTTPTAYRGPNRNLHHKKLGLELLEDRRLLSDLSIGLQAYWGFNGNGVDNSGKNRDLTLQGNPNFSPGLLGQAIDLQGNANQCARRLMDDSIFDFGFQDFTIQTWVNYHTLSEVQIAIEKFSGSNGPGWTVAKLDAPGSSNDVFHYYQSSNLTINSTRTNIKTDTWYQLVTRRSGGTVEMFLNANSIGNVYVGAAAIPDTVKGILIGRRNEADGRGGFPMNGKIDEVAIWTRALSNDDINFLYNGGSGHIISPENPTLFETLARDIAYNGSWKKDDSFLSYTVDCVFQNVDGFYALALKSDIYGPALVIRGTEKSQLSDWWSDLDADGVGYTQFKDNWASVYSWLTKPEMLANRADIVGHSLGGAVAQWIAAKFTSVGGKIDQLVTFNSPGITNNEWMHPNLLTYASRFVATCANGVTHYIVNGDIVSMAGEAYVTGNVQEASFSDPWLWDFKKHTLPLLTTSIGGQHPPSDLSWKSITTAELSSSTFSFSDPDYNRFLLGAEIGLLLLDPASPLVAVPAMLKFRGTTEYGRQLIGQAFREAFGSFECTADANGNYVLSYEHGSYRISVAPGFSLTVDNGSPPMLQFAGGLSIDLGASINLSLPSWLGGPYKSDSLVHLAKMDLNGVIDRNRLLAHGELACLGGLLMVDGTGELDWTNGKWALGGQIIAGDGLISASGSIQVGSQMDLTIMGEGAVAIPDSVPWIGGTHIDGGDFMLKFVNDGNLANDFIAGWGSLDGTELGLRVWLDGKRDILGADEIASIGDPPYSESYAISPGTTWVLFGAEWQNASTTAAITLTNPSGQVVSESDIASDPSMSFVTELGTNRRKAVRVNAPMAGTWAMTITDTTGLGTGDIAAFTGDPMPIVSVAGLSGGMDRQPVLVDIDAYNAGSQARIALFYDNNNHGYDGVMIADGILASDGRIQYSWDTSAVAAGDYYVYAMILDDNNPPVFAYSGAPVTVDKQIANRTWDGGGGDNKWMTPANWVGDVAPFPGDTLVFPAGAVRLESVNDYPAGTQFGSITVFVTGYNFQNGILTAAGVAVTSGTLTTSSIVADTLIIGTSNTPATRIWDGGGSDNKWSTSANWTSDFAPLPGDNLVFAVGATKQANLNDYSAGMVFGSITVLGGDYQIQNGVVASGDIDVSAGSLTTTSIVCDTLTIGSPSTAATSNPPSDAGANINAANMRGTLAVPKYALPAQVKTVDAQSQPGSPDTDSESTNSSTDSAHLAVSSVPTPVLLTAYPLEMMAAASSVAAISVEVTPLIVTSQQEPISKSQSQRIDSAINQIQHLAPAALRSAFRASSLWGIENLQTSLVSKKQSNSEPIASSTRIEKSEFTCFNGNSKAHYAAMKSILQEGYWSDSTDFDMLYRHVSGKKEKLPVKAVDELLSVERI